MKNLKLRIGGVPEHFNLPWHLAIDSGAIADLGVDATWQDFPGGTGSMVSALNDGDVDIAMLLSEGAVKGQVTDGDFEIVSFYTKTPLVWGMHVPTNSNLHSINDLKDATFVISRKGSGSHLMSYILADQQGWDLTGLKFKPVGHLDGAREHMRKGEDCVFLWEKFMTKPYVDNGEFRLIGELPTPWPCFVICVRKPIWNQSSEILSEVFKCVFETAYELKNSPIAAKLIAAQYKLQLQDAKDWLDITQWEISLGKHKPLLAEIKQTLKSIGIV